MKIFICHASEDKNEFVRPLAEALRTKHEVWFDEWSLVIGNSLLQKINEGLASCDFAVVVLSPAFFTKPWPQSELDGVFALEDSTRKLIIPIWKDLSEADVKRFSPILAGRLAARASDGVDAVVKQIETTIEASRRTREISTQRDAVEKALQVGQTIAEQQNAFQLLHSEEGVALILSALRELADIFRSFARTLAKEAQPLKLSVLPQPMALSSNDDFRVSTNYGQSMQIGLTGFYMNCANTAELHALLFQTERFPARLAKKHSDMKFKPTFRRPKEVIWQCDAIKRTFTTKTLADHLLGKLTEQVEKQFAQDYRR